jgi:hypothetical protein
MENDGSDTSHKKRRLQRSTLLIALLVVACGFFAAGYFRSAGTISKLQQGTVQSSDEEATRLVSKISKFMTLPKEKPTIATVEDASKLASQSFFKHSQKGDKVLMFTAAKKAILYRPSQNKIIEVAYLNVENKPDK